MKVIVAGMCKTGTKSMNAALTQLGFKVYDYVENVILLGDEYCKITHEGWTTKDFRQMYENVDAVVDTPAFYFWQEIHEAFPDAKVVLTLRDSEEQWYRSLQNEIDTEDRNFLLRVVLFFSPTYRKMMCRFGAELATVALGTPPQSVYRWRLKLNKTMLIKRYKAHNDLVMKNTPPDKLLVFKCKQGWEPLCKFLQLPVPDNPFPHKNKGAEVVNNTINFHPIALKIRNEGLLHMGVFLTLLTTTGFLLCKFGPTGLLRTMSEGVTSAMSKIMGNK